MKTFVVILAVCLAQVYTQNNVDWNSRKVQTCLEYFGFPDLIDRKTNHPRATPGSAEENACLGGCYDWARGFLNADQSINTNVVLNDPAHTRGYNQKVVDAHSACTKNRTLANICQLNACMDEEILKHLYDPGTPHS